MTTKKSSVRNSHRESSATRRGAATGRFINKGDGQWVRPTSKPRLSSRPLPSPGNQGKVTGSKTR